MKRFSSTLIGIFVLGGLILAVVGILSFGAQAWWRDSEHVVVYFDETVHGLERGSAVKLMGVPVGRVSNINVSYLSREGTVVQVVCEIDRSPFLEDTVGETVDMRDAGALRQMVADGLQARLNIIGITGMLYIELDFFAEPSPKLLALEHPEYVVVPSAPSAFAGLVDNLAEISNELGAIDFAGIGDSARRLLDTANTTLEEARLQELFAELHRAVGGVNEMLESEELKRAIVSAGDSFEDLSRLAQSLEAEVEPLSENLAGTSEEMKETLREIGQTFATVQEMIGPRLGLGLQISDTLRTIDDAARTVERLADFLERNPQAIVRGRADDR